MSYFGSNLKLLRKRRSRSQADVSQTLKITRSSWSAYENEAAEPNFDTLMKIAKYFSVPIDVFLKEDLHEFSELRLTNLENGFDVDVSGRKLRVLTTTVNQNDEENIEITDYIYARDMGSVDGGSYNAGEPFEVGNYFYLGETNETFHRP